MRVPKCIKASCCVMLKNISVCKMPKHMQHATKKGHIDFIQTYKYFVILNIINQPGECHEEEAKKKKNKGNKVGNSNI